MKKLFTLFAAALMAFGAYAQTEEAEKPLYTATGQLVEDEESEASFTTDGKMKVEVYDGYTIVRAWAGVEGYDICLVHAEGDLTEGVGVTSAFNIINGETKEPSEADGYIYLYTGREDYYLAAITLSYNGYDYTTVYSEEVDGVMTGSVDIWFPYWYDANNEYITPDYHLVWPAEEEEVLPEGCLFSTEASFYADEEGTASIDFKTNVKVEMYDGYTIVRAWAGVEGYDICLVHAEGDLTEGVGVTSVFNIINGEMQEPYEDGGIYYLYTGREDYYCAGLYLTCGDYDYVDVTSAEVDGEKTGTVDIWYAYWYDANNEYECSNYLIEWPKTSGTTAIDRVVETPATEHDAMFNLAGQRVGADYKGLVVKNGKVMIIR